MLLKGLVDQNIVKEYTVSRDNFGHWIDVGKFSRTDLQGFGQRPSQRDNYITKLDNKLCK